MQFFATCAKALEPLVARELSALGAADIAETRAGVAFSGALEVAYGACLWLRIASRVLLPLATVDAADDHALYHGVRTIRWLDHVGPDQTIAVDAPGVALKVKDAIVDQIRDETGRRPSVDTASPDLRVNVHLHAGRRPIDRSVGREPAPPRLARRRRGGAAQGEPRRRHADARRLAAPRGRGRAAVRPHVRLGHAADRSGAHGRRRRARPGTRALRLPRLARPRRRAVATAVRRGARAPPAEWPRACMGFDHDARAVKSARDNARRAGVADAIEFRVGELADAAPPAAGPGVVVMNPPYGERLGEAPALGPLYEQIGAVLRHRFTGWDAFVLTSNPELQKRIGLRAARRHVLYNGPLECRLLELPIAAEAPKAPMRPRSAVRAEAFANRLHKNYAHLKKWAAREDVHCWRVYDADLVEYAVAIDLYETAAHVQEYAPPATIDPARAEERLGDVIALVPEVLGVAATDIYVKQRRRQRAAAGQQYGRMAARGKKRTVREGGHQFLVNLSDYLDTGLFLDHRRLRATIESLARGKTFLNLFAYTGSATVYAAAGGARSSVSVDLSNTYLEWAAENLALNRVSPRAHELVRSDVDPFLAGERRRFDLIFCAPPTFSNSKGATRDFDVQRDHVALIQACMRLLADGGVLLFSNHFRRFKMDAAALPELELANITKQTLPLDFQRDPRFHNSWRITKR